MVRRVVAGPAVFGAALTVSTVVVAAADGRAPVLAAAVVAVGALPALWWLARRRSGGVLGALALRCPASAVVGALVVGAAAALVIGADALAGGVRVVSADPSALFAFLLATTVLALLHEALPEELAFRGLTFGACEGRSRWLAAIATSVLFVLVPPLASGLGTAVASMVVPGAGPARFAPEGQHVVDYLVLLALFGSMLVLLRLLTGSVWACVAAHVAFLLVNRVLLGRPGTGVAVELPPGGELLVPAYLLLAIAGLALALALRARRHRELAALG